ncbi:E3 ubiquitin-protein ligase TM129-like [Ptychodera flava]|uniref:E3 ubiquitin-protein ligase TM129-like n=1 Tax=Ptychodera flava TaxID=63121 RepID=UPI00396AAA23
MSNTSTEFIFTLGYWLVALCLAVPPQEFQSAGLTIQNLLSHWLGSEELHFVYYHMKRTTATVVFHSLIPIGYYIGLAIAVPDLDLWNISQVRLLWKVYLICSVIFCIVSCSLAFYWSRKKWNNHPIAIKLGYLGDAWRAVASSVNIEFRRIDKFASGPIGRRVIVTDSWVIKTTTYSIDIAHQGDVHLTLEESQTHDIHYESNTTVQFLNIRVDSVNPHTKSFKVRLNSIEYNDLKDKLSAPIRNVRNILIHQSLTDKFLETFRDQVQLNPVYHLPSNAVDLDPCIGCMQSTANIKLQKLCDNPDRGDCVQCYCRPMWCLECMSKWFASRQNQNEPQTWLSSKSPCPTCRAKFCILDVCRVQR